MDLSLASYKKRFFATLIDGLLMAVFGLLLNFVFNGYVHFLLSSLIFLGYNYYFLSKTGQTIGKRFLNIKAVDLSGKLLAPRAIIKRELIAKMIPNVLSYFFPILTIPEAIYIIVSCLFPLWHPKKQTLPDIYSQTVVINA
jgi:uncharacterized RDD family membrane protein YckC